MSSKFEWQQQFIERRSEQNLFTEDHRRARISNRRRAIALSVEKFVILVLLYFAVTALGL